MTRVKSDDRSNLSKKYGSLERAIQVERMDSPILVSHTHIYTHTQPPSPPPPPTHTHTYNACTQQLPKLSHTHTHTYTHTRAPQSGGDDHQFDWDFVRGRMWCVVEELVAGGAVIRGLEREGEVVVRVEGNKDTVQKLRSLMNSLHKNW